MSILHVGNRRAKKSSRSDWHSADIKAALEKAGWTFARIAREYGYARTSPADVLRRPWAAMEEIIGEILKICPAKIWPSRYDEEGHPLRSRQKFTKSRESIHKM